MAAFGSEQDVYDQLGPVLAELVGPPLARADAIVQYRLRAPEAVITLDLRRDSDPACVFGLCDLAPDVVMSMDADTAHRLFLGRVNIAVALARGEIRASGPPRKLLKLVALMKPSRELVAP